MKEYKELEDCEVDELILTLTNGIKDLIFDKLKSNTNTNQNLNITLSCLFNVSYNFIDQFMLEPKKTKYLRFLSLILKEGISHKKVSIN